VFRGVVAPASKFQNTPQDEFGTQCNPGLAQQTHFAAISVDMGDVGAHEVTTSIQGSS